LVEPQPLDGSDPLANYRSVREELERYDAALGRRPEIVAVTKSDLPEAQAVRDWLAEQLDMEMLLISAVTGQGLNELLSAIAQTLENRHE
jgi:GTP-binding protein